MRFTHQPRRMLVATITGIAFPPAAQTIPAEEAIPGWRERLAAARAHNR